MYWMWNGQNWHFETENRKTLQWAARSGLSKMWEETLLIRSNILVIIHEMEGLGKEKL